MKSEFFRPKRLISLVLALLLALPMLSACRSETGSDPAPALTVNKDGELHFLYRPNAAEIQAHAEQIAYLYEFAPGETLADINSKSSVSRIKTSSKIEFTLPLTDENGVDRRCNTYVLTYSDGTIHPSSATLSNPEALAYQTADFPHANSIKGLNAANQELARTLHTRHTLVSLSASALLESDGATATYNNVTFPINGTLMYEADEKIKSAAGAGMQISLEFTVEPQVSTSVAATLIQYLTERYSTDEIGNVTALVLRDGGAVSAEDPAFAGGVTRSAELIRVARTALLSRVKNGRIYYGADAHLSLMKEYVTAAVETAKEAGVPSVGIALYPTSVTEGLLHAEEEKGTDGEEAAEEAEDRKMLLSDVLDTADHFTDKLGRTTKFAILGIDISAEEQELQAALLAYAYRVSVLADAELMIYKSLVGADTGLYAESGEARLAAECFSRMDGTDNVDCESLAEELLGEEWTALKKIRGTRVSITDLSNVASTEEAGKRYFDFTGDDSPAFTAVGTAVTPTAVYSELWQSNVMATTFTENIYGMASGMRCELPNVKRLENMHVLSANVLPKSSDADWAEITLLLEGTSTDGKEISYRSTVKMTCNTWQSVSFHIRGFTSLLNTAYPCTMSLTMRPLAENEGAEGAENGSAEPVGEQPVHSLWLQSVNLRGASTDYSSLLMIGFIVGCFAFGFSVILFSLRKKKREKKGR